MIGSDGSQVGVVETAQALAQAREEGLDLVEVAPQADPPVCKILDYGKFKYQESIRAREARRKQASITVKEIKFRPKIGVHDYQTKKGHIERFLSSGNRVKVTVWFRGREMAHTELGERILRRLTEELSEIATVETFPKLDGRNMTMMLAPVRGRKESGKPGGSDAEDEA